MTTVEKPGLALGAPAADWLRTWNDNAEQLRGAWNDADDLVFVDRERPQPGPWTAARAEPGGLHHFYLQGKAHRQSGEFNGATRPRICPAGSLQFVQPDERVHPAGEGATRTLHVMVSQRFLDTQFDGRIALDARPRRHRGHRGDVALGLLARAHEAGIDRGLPGRELYFESLRQAILERAIGSYGRWLSKGAPEADTLAPFKARRVAEHVDAHLRDDLTLDQLAQVAQLSKFHFARSFRHAFGMGPHAFVTQRRLARALDLVHQARPVAEVARDCGFADHAHLTRTFKSRFGVPPSALQAPRRIGAGCGG